jgi:2-dehydro-3-deoxy-D-arabinonate dehydratase
MHLRRIRHQGTTSVGLVEGETIRLLGLPTPNPLSHVLHSADPAAMVRKAPTTATVPLAGAETLPPLDEQEVWAAGVTYIRSKVAREEESAGSGGARFYDMVYTADRPELFFKAPASRVIADKGTVRIRRDARWSVPEPELALVVSPAGKIVGYTAGNDMSSRDIEGVNPLYLPQAKFYDGACAIGPGVTLAGFLPPPAEVVIRVGIAREGKTVFGGSTSLAAMKRSLEELVSWLYRETSFPNGAILLTGTGVVPPDDFTLALGDIVTIDIAGVGRLVNTVG